MYDTPQAAEAAFYEAFERADLRAMMQVWAPDDAVACVHPLGPRTAGHEAVEQSWREVFEHSGALRFDLLEIQHTLSDVVCAHCVHELISHGESYGQRALVIATNVYRLTDAGWRICLHHASPGRLEAVVLPAPGGALH